MKASKGKHNQYIDLLVERYSKKYEFMVKNVHYKCPYTGVEGEIDILGKRKNQIDLYEVKCNDKYQHAVDQLFRAMDALNTDCLEIRLFYYSGSRNKLKRVK